MCIPTRVIVVIAFFTHTFSTYPGNSSLFSKLDVTNDSISDSNTVKLHDLPVDSDDDDEEAETKSKTESDFRHYEKRSDDPMYRHCYDETPPADKIGSVKNPLPLCTLRMR